MRRKRRRERGEEIGFAEVERRATHFSSKHHFNTYTSIVVAVDHDGGPAVEIHIEIPPVCDIIGSPPGLQVEVTLHLLTRTILHVDAT